MLSRRIELFGSYFAGAFSTWSLRSNYYFFLKWLISSCMLLDVSETWTSFLRIPCVSIGCINLLLSISILSFHSFRFFSSSLPEIIDVAVTFSYLRSGLFYMKGASLIYLLTGFKSEYLYSSRYSSYYSFSLLMYSKNCFFILSQRAHIVIRQSQSITI